MEEEGKGGERIYVSERREVGYVLSDTDILNDQVGGGWEEINT